jgi:hypothetical protein
MIIRSLDSFMSKFDSPPVQELTAMADLLRVKTLSESKHSVETIPGGPNVPVLDNYPSIELAVSMLTYIQSLISKSPGRACFRQAKITVLLIKHLKLLSDHVQPQNSEKQAELQPLLLNLQVYEAVMLTLERLVEYDADYLKLFRAGGADLPCYRLINHNDYRLPLLRFISRHADSYILSTLIALLGDSSCTILTRADIFYCIGCIVRTSSKLKRLWKDSGGFECILSVLSHLKKAFSDTEKVDESWELLGAIFFVVKMSSSDEPSNRAYIQLKCFPDQFCELLISTCVMSSVKASTVLQSLLDLSTEIEKEQDQNVIKKFAQFVVVDLKTNRRTDKEPAPQNLQTKVLNLEIPLEGKSSDLSVLSYFDGLNTSSTSVDVILPPIHTCWPIRLLLHLAKLSSLDTEVAALRCIASLVDLSYVLDEMRNIQVLQQDSVLKYVLEQYGGYLTTRSQSSETRVDTRSSLVSRIVEGLAAHFVSPAELRSLLRCIPGSIQKYLLGIAVRGQASATFIEMEMHRRGFASIDIPTVDQAFISALNNSFSFACWINIRHLQYFDRFRVTNL